MSALTYNGSSVVTYQGLPTYTVTSSNGTLGSGQQYRAKTPDSGPGYPAIVYCHSAGGDETQISTAGNVDTITTRLAQRGFPVIAGRISGNSWGNDASHADIDELLTHARANQDAHATLMIGFGLSMGSISLLAWAGSSGARLAQMTCLLGIVPAVDLVDLHDNRGYDTSIDTAYTDHAGYLAAIATHDPQTLAENGALDGLHAKLWYGGLDPAVVPATVEAFAATIGSTVETEEFPALEHLLTAALTPPPQVVSYAIGQYAPTAALRQLVTT